MPKEPSRRPTRQVRVGTLQVTYRSRPNAPTVFKGLAREDEVQMAQRELRKHKFPNQRAGTAQNLKKETMDVPLYRMRERGRPGITPVGKATLKLGEITKIELLDPRTVEIPDMS